MTDVVNIGTNPNDGLGDSLRVAFSKLNAFLETLSATVDELEAFQESGMLGFDTLASLNADLVHPSGTLALVTNDPTPANNIIYRKTGASGAGSWVAQAEGVWASSATVAAMQVLLDDLAAYFSPLAAEDAAYAITDEGGRVAFDVDQQGRIRIPYQKALPDGLIRTLVDAQGNAAEEYRLNAAVDGFAWAITDSAGRVALGVHDDGTVVCEALEAAQITGTVSGSEAMTSGNFTAEINFFPAYGQSWAVGIANEHVTGTQRFDSLSFSGGVRTQSISDDPGVVYTSFIPLVERTDAGTPEFPTGGAGETPAAGQTDMVKERLLAENGIAYTQQAYQLLASAPGAGSKSLEELSKPSTYYTRLMAQVQAGFDLAVADGKSYAVQAVSWAQGAAGDDANYGTLLEALRDDIETDAQAITSQPGHVKLITWQA
ncbi:MAG TPA: hypothetical protein VF104_07465, partial [Burkholderiales bacterium]